MSQIELKPCPACGSPARMMVSKGMAGTACKSRYWRGYAHCKSKRCGFSARLEKSPEKAIAAWNTRPLPSADRAEPVAWLVERHWPERIEYLKMTGYGVNWVRDANEAMRLSRREDAEQMAAGAFDEDDVRVAEHMWPGESAPPPDKVVVTREDLELCVQHFADHRKSPWCELGDRLRKALSHSTGDA